MVTITQEIVFKRGRALLVVRAIDRLVMTFGHVVMWSILLLIGAIVAQVSLRYLFNVNFPKLDEIQWYLYGLVTLTGLSYAMCTDSHVRVDVLHSGLSLRAQRMIEVLGIFLLLAPFTYLMLDQGYEYFYESFRVNERSISPVGLPARWALKAVIPLSFLLLALAALGRLIATLHAMGMFGGASGGGSGSGGGARRGLKAALLAISLVVIGGIGLGFLTGTTEEKLVVAMFLSFIVLLFTGFPVAWTLAGVGIAFCGIAYAFDNGWMLWTGLEETFTGLDYLSLGAVVNRVHAIMSNPVLVALPMFIFMGLMLDESGVARRLMISMARIFGRLRGGLAITVALIGIVLAASTGIIGASVVLLGVLSLPTMMEQRYSPSLAAGIVSASGTLGILIPPSIMLVIMADQMALSVGDLFMAAVLPGALLGALYLAYIVIATWLNKDLAPVADDAIAPDLAAVKDVLFAVLPTLGLILAVLGSVFAGIATPTEASGVGAFGAVLLAISSAKFSLNTLISVLKATFRTTAYIVAVFLGATVFSYVLRELGGDALIEDLVRGTGFGPGQTVFAILCLVFLLGFVLDWIEITLIILPLMRPIVNGLGLDVPDFGTLDEPVLIWFVILVAVTLQTSFLTPPVGFALFYLRGVCPPQISLSHVYRGILPFVILQLICLAIIFLWPSLATWLPAVAY